MEKINVTKTFLPPIEDYQRYLKEIWKSNQLTNQGSLLMEFEKQVKQKLGVADFQFLTNGTLALQVAIKSLELGKGEIITTPFSYVATTSAILWEGYSPVFVDIEPDTYCMDANKIEASITKKTKAIMPVHVFGHPCEIEKISAIAKKYDLKVIYDGAHAFGVTYKGESLLSYGDISTCSFHATKLFHTIEGGCVIAGDREVGKKVDLMKRFGHNSDEHFMLGINTKASEFQAAMGLCNLKYIDEIIVRRRQKAELYDQLLNDRFQRPKINEDTQYNYAYYPVVLDSEAQLIKICEKLNKENIFPRRYFYPSLNTLPYIDRTQSCPVSEDISKRIVCLPLYPELEDEVINKICEIVNK